MVGVPNRAITAVIPSVRSLPRIGIFTSTLTEIERQLRARATGFLVGADLQRELRNLRILTPSIGVVDVLLVSPVPRRTKDGRAHPSDPPAPTI
jgi:hypothetical protein